jgi:plasmid stabilization system protein ParE
MKVLLTRGAEQDLRGIWTRRRQQRGNGGSDGADTLLDQLVALIDTLAGYPRKGPVRPELEALGISTYRQLSKAPYRIIYSCERVDQAEANVVHLVADARRDFRTLLAERLLSS